MPLVLLLAAALLACFSATRAAAEARADQGAVSAPQRAVDERLLHYNSAFPDILFVQLPGGEEWVESSRTFQDLLGGGDAANLDYEHPPELREDLLTVSVGRVLSMLRHNATSSALFRVGEDSAATRDHVCVITLDPHAAAGDDDLATAHLLDVPPQLLERIPPHYQLDRTRFLRFLIDHEVFHCLDARYLGPIPMSDREHWGPYMLYRNENGADAYAAAMHLAEGGDPGFLDNLIRIRALCLYSADPEHATCGALRAAASLDRRSMAGLSPWEVLRLAHRIRMQVVPDYAGYLRYRAAACQAMRDIGVPRPPADDALCRAAAPDPAVYRELMESYRRSYRELFGHPPEGKPAR